MTVMKAPIIGWYKGKRIERRYRAVVVMEVYGPVVRIEEELGDQDKFWAPTPGEWYIKSLLESDKAHSMVALDYKMDWAVSGVRAAAEEALLLLVPKGGEALVEMARTEDTNGSSTEMG